MDDLPVRDINEPVRYLHQQAILQLYKIMDTLRVELREAYHVSILLFSDHCWRYHPSSRPSFVIAKGRLAEVAFNAEEPTKRLELKIMKRYAVAEQMLAETAIWHAYKMLVLHPDRGRPTD